MKDYLKYWRVVRQYIKKKYKINLADMELLLYLNSERYFTATDIREGANIMCFEKNRANRLEKEGWIELFRPRRGAGASIYQLSWKSKGMIRHLYQKLDGHEISTTARYNPLFKKDVGYSAKTYRNFILKRNATIRQQQHPSQ